MEKLPELFYLLILVASALSGCATTVQNSKEETPRIVGDIPTGSPFSKITIGMSMGHVSDLIGMPNDRSSYATGKAFIPFYYGNDRTRIEAYYKGQGRITFAGGSGFGGRSNKVYRIIYDPSENGYNEK